MNCNSQPCLGSGAKQVGPAAYLAQGRRAERTIKLRPTSPQPQGFSPEEELISVGCRFVVVTLRRCGEGEASIAASSRTRKISSLR